MFRSNTACIATAILTLLPMVGYAHEGHGHTSDQGNTLLHYMIEPYHLLQLVTVVMIVMAIRLIVWRRQQKTLHVK